MHIDTLCEGLDAGLTVRAMGIASRVAHAALCTDDMEHWLGKIGFTPAGDNFEVSIHGLDCRVEVHAGSRIWMYATAADALNTADSVANLRGGGHDRAFIVNTTDRPLLLGEVRH